ncbi:MAG: DUF58 domain-containing protein [Deferrisomatales bacterium]
MLERADLLDPELVARVARRDLPGPPSPFPQRGLHRSPRRGASLEFSEHTEYTPGDDLRHLDWRVYGKSDRYFVKRYEDERLQRAVVLVDASASMAYGGREGGLRGSKYHLAARVAVALAAALLRQGDAVGVAVAGGGPGGSPGVSRDAWLPPRSGPSQLEAAIEVLAAAEPAGQVDLTAACRGVGERLRRAAAVFLVSDLLDPGQEDLPGPRWLKARGVRPRLVQVLHADEVDLPFDATTRFLDLEGPGSLVLDPLAVRRAYAEEVRDWVRGLARAAGLLGAPYALVTTAGDPAAALEPLLRRLGRG